MNTESSRLLGQKLKEVRKLLGLTQAQVGAAIGMSAAGSSSYVSRLEQGEIPKVALVTVVRYLQACKAPVGKFMLELAQAGAFGEAEQGLTVVDDKTKAEEAKRAKAKMLRDKRWEREAQDAEIVYRLWTDVLAVIVPMLPLDPSRRYLGHYLEGVKTFYRAWKRAVRGALNRDPVLDVQIAFDRIERVGLQKDLVSSAVHKMREMVFERLMAMIPQGGSI